MSKEAGDAVKDDEKGTISNPVTPMWQIGGLAKHHGLKPIYNLEKEDPKKKSKRFTMSLTLGDEVFTGQGCTKKQAQQNAASKAIKGTKLTFPQPTKKATLNLTALTTTVRLNGWAITNRKKVAYTLCEKRYLPSSQQYNMQQQQLMALSMPYQGYPDNTFLFPANGIPGYYSTTPDPQYKPPRKNPSYFRVCVQVEEDKFFGEGSTQQAARHDAAKNALDGLAIDYQADVSALGRDKNPKTQDSSETSAVGFLNEEVLGRNMSLTVRIIDEKGPPHLKCYTVEMIVGYFVAKKLDEKHVYFKTVASGTSKKAAKHAAACEILKEMKEKLPPREPPVPKIEKGPLKGHRPPTTVLHPVSRLMQLCQAQKIMQAKYELVEETPEKKVPDSYTMKCTVQDKKVTGTGKSKKDAKKAAAEAMIVEISKQLNLQDIPNKNMLPQKSNLKTNNIDIEKTKRLHVKFIDDDLKT